ISGNQGVNIGNGTNVTAKDDVDVTSPNGSINIVGTNVTAETGKINITAKENTTIINSNISSNTGITINSTNGSTLVDGNTITTSGDLEIGSNANTTVTNNTFNVGDHTNLTSVSYEAITFTGNKGVINSTPSYNGRYSDNDSVLIINPNLTINHTLTNPQPIDPSMQDPASNYDDWLIDSEDYYELEKGDRIGEMYNEENLSVTVNVNYIPVGETITVTPTAYHISTCMATIDDVLANYQITYEDSQTLSIDQLIRKYNVSKADTARFSSACSIVPSYLHNKLSDSKSKKEDK
ncbi:hypothetical protein, partial [Psittacicella hinzii]